MKGEGGRVGFEILAELLGFGLAVGGARDQDPAGFLVALALLLDNQGEDGLCPGLELANCERERPSSGIRVGNGRRCFSSSRVTPTCRSSALSMKISGLPSPFQSATARSLMPARVGKVFGAANEPSFCWT